MLKLGEKSIKSLYLGSKAIKKAYLGAKLVFNKITKPYYCEIEYLESTGTQYIDTEYIPNNNTSVEMIVSGVSANSFSVSSGTWFIGARQGYLNKAFGFYYNPSNQNFYYAFGNNMPYSNYSSSLLYEKTVKIKLDKTGLYVNDSKVVTATDTTFTTPVNLSLFGLNNNGTTISFTSFKNHSCKISENGVLIRDYIPVLDFNMKPCLYDKVSGKLFYNQGTGEFLYGEKAESPSEPITLIGNTKIENGVLSGFDEESHAIVNYALPNDLMQHEFEIVFDITTGSDVGNRQSIFDTNVDDASNGYWLAFNSNGFWFDYIKEGTAPEISNGLTARPIRRNENYTIKFTNKGVSTPTFYEKSKTYPKWTEKTAFNVDVVHGKFALGKYPAKYTPQYGGTTTATFKGVFNLANCYIEIDGVKVWEGIK